MNFVKNIIKNDSIKKILKFLNLIYINFKDKEIVVSIKDKFKHNERSFYYKRMKYLVDCLYCHAAPGTIETIITNLDKLGKNLKILSLGGGSGQVSKIFKELGHDIVNVDLEVEEENEKNIQFDLNSNKELPLELKSFDVIICQEIIEHIENPWNLFRTVKKFLKNDGVFYLTTPNIQSLRSKNLFKKKGYFEWFSPEALSYHINPIPFWEIELICEKLNFEITDITGNGEYYFKKDKKKKEIINNNETLIFSIKNK